MSESAAAATADAQGKSESTGTVIVAFAMNVLIAIAKTIAALVTSSASLVAEAAHSWADAGNEIFLVTAEHRAHKTPDAQHPAGYGREAYVWSMFAALGLFVAGAAISITHGITQLINPEPASDFLVGYIVLALSFILEGISFAQSVRQIRREATQYQRDFLEHVVKTSDPTLRAVFAEDAAALIGLVIAAAALGIHELTDSPIPDSIGSILIGLLLGYVAIHLLNRNRRFLVGEEADEKVRSVAIRSLLDQPEIERVTYLRLEIVGPRMLDMVAEVDLVGNQVEQAVATQLRDLEQRVCAMSPVIVHAHVGLSVADEPSIHS
ncbi:MAG: cation diffusion facilitator family transporter [Antricoccus sp.]